VARAFDSDMVTRIEQGYRLRQSRNAQIAMSWTSAAAMNIRVAVPPAGKAPVDAPNPPTRLKAAGANPSASWAMPAGGNGVHSAAAGFARGNVDDSRGAVGTRAGLSYWWRQTVHGAAEPTLPMRHAMSHQQSGKSVPLPGGRSHPLI
jgi:hypothetical protein